MVREAAAVAAASPVRAISRSRTPSKSKEKEEASTKRSPAPKERKPRRVGSVDAAAPSEAEAAAGSKSAPIPETIGTGAPHDPIRQPLRLHPNSSNCFHCATSKCHCVKIDELLRETYQSTGIKRLIQTSSSDYASCAKSILTPFVTRMVAIANISKDDTFIDLGSGNGSVLFQIAFLTGAACVGVELNEHNANLSRVAWDIIKPKLEHLAGRPMPSVTIITGDLCQYLSSSTFQPSPNVVIWSANLLMPRSVTNYMSERFRDLPEGARILCFDDLYPHGRAAARRRDPDAFAKFRMVDYMWQEMTVEWTAMEGNFFYYERRNQVEVTE